MDEEKLISRAIIRLERENHEQQATISKICSVLKIEDLSSLIPFFYNNSEGKLDNSCTNETYSDQVRILEQILQEKEENHRKLQSQINVYLQKADSLEMELAKNEQEKVEILKRFQMNVNHSEYEESVSIEQLESEIEVISEKKESLKKERQDLRKQCQEYQQILRTNHDYSKELHNQLLSMNGKINSYEEKQNLIYQLREKENQIEILENRLKKALNQISQLQNDNDVIRKILRDSSSDSD